MTDSRPGLSPRRLVVLMESAIRRTGLDLDQLVVLTEAASGAYAVTPVLAAMAGAKHVFALARGSRYGTVEQITEQTKQLAEQAGVLEDIEIIEEKSRGIVTLADIVTNCGHLRPLDATTIGWMKPTAVIPLMYEAWELRPEDVDLAACRQRGIAVAGTSECHPDVDVFSYLGIMAIKLLLDAGIAVYGSRILLLCDNRFESFLERGLVSGGANVEAATSLLEVERDGDWDAVLVALTPQSRPVLGERELSEIAGRAPAAVVAQLWGDLDRAALSAAGLSVWPPEAPPAKHMGILPSAVGPEPIVRLQAGGLKVGQMLAQGRLRGVAPSAIEREVEQAGWGQRVNQ